MFEAVIAPIAFAVIMLLIFGSAIMVYVRRRMTSGTSSDATYESENDHERDQRRAG